MVMNMELLKIILGIELSLGALALVIVGIRTFGPRAARKWLATSVATVTSALHLTP